MSFPGSGDDTNGSGLLDAIVVDARVVMFGVVTKVVWLLV